MLVGGLQRPGVVEVGEQLAAAERHGLLEAVLRHALANSAWSTHRPVPAARPTRSRVVTSTALPADPSERRSAHSALRMLWRALGSRTSGQKRAATRARGCIPG